MSLEKERTSGDVPRQDAASPVLPTVNPNVKVNKPSSGVAIPSAFYVV